MSCFQALKKELRDVFAVYVGFATELENQSKQLMEWMDIIGKAVQGDQGGDTQSKLL